MCVLLRCFYPLLSCNIAVFFAAHMEIITIKEELSRANRKLKLCPKPKKEKRESLSRRNHTPDSIVHSNIPVVIVFFGAFYSFANVLLNDFQPTVPKIKQIKTIQFILSVLHLSFASFSNPPEQARVKQKRKHLNAVRSQKWHTIRPPRDSFCQCIFLLSFPW